MTLPWPLLPRASAWGSSLLRTRRAAPAFLRPPRHARAARLARAAVAGLDRLGFVPLPFILASRSPARLATLRSAGIEPTVHISDVDEDAVLAAAAVTFPLERGRELTPADAVLELARAKAEAVAQVRGEVEAVELGCDSMLELAGEILGKPHDAEVARDRWRMMRGRSGVLHTGHWLMRIRPQHGGAVVSGVGGTGSTVVHFADLEDEEIDAYVATGEPLHVAGAFTVDGLGGPFVESIDGDFHNVVGISLPLLRHLLDTDGDAGSIGTIGAYDGRGRAVESTAGSLTTPGPVDLQATLRGLVDRGVKFVAMEASSHALAQRRLDAISFSGGVFTNLTRDHLDYHGNMDDYLGAKLRLASLVKGDGVLSVNADDPAWRGLDSDPRTITWGNSPDAALRINDLHALPGGSHFGIEGRFGKAEVQLPLPGDFNVSNAIAAAAIALGIGRSLEEVAARLATAPQVPGRMERIASAPFHVVRDYAHTPDALERLLATLRAITPGRILLVFGCGGDRDRGKRPQMGAIAARGADVVFLTSDNPRTEDPEAILDDIAAGMSAGSYQREADRHLAIATALGQARPGDVVVLAGKGHETYQVVGTERQPFDEREIVRGLMGR